MMDEPPVISSADAEVVMEGDSGTTDVTFTVSLDAAIGRAVTVAYGVDATTSTATAGSDFTALPPGSRLTFPEGETQKDITLKVIGDELVSRDETVAIKLSDPAYVSLGTALASGVTNDDTLLRWHPAALVQGERSGRRHSHGTIRKMPVSPGTSSDRKSS